MPLLAALPLASVPIPPHWTKSSASQEPASSDKSLWQEAGQEVVVAWRQEYGTTS